MILIFCADCKKWYDVFPTAMLVFGCPTEQQKERSKPERCDMKYVVHENGYKNIDGEQLRNMMHKEY